ncbi:MAG TPA: hypothetical protein VMR74_08630 [Gammaproteobacteria bacterium]|nr:hypothetical protein [Gammaproteobacteria bacterium]
MEPSVPVTLRVVATVAAALYRLRGLLLIAGAAALVWLGLVILEPERASTSALLPLTLVLWAALALAMAYTLPQLPPAIAAGDGLALRLRKRLRQAAYGLAFVAMLLVAGFVLYLSWRALPLVIV